MKPSRDNNDASDSEDDEDYVPPAEDPATDSDREPDAKRAKTDDTDAPRQLTAAEELERKRARDALLASFRSSTPSSSHLPPSSTHDSTRQTRMVTIEKRYRFAGEDIIKIETVPEDSEDAKKWPRHVHDNAMEGTSKSPAHPTQISSTTPTPTPLSVPTPTPTRKPPAKRPGPRKPKTLLTPLPSSSTAKKLTILDKSALDWKSHVSSGAEGGGDGGEVGLRDELEANRRGGGYLEKVEFLRRVEERREEVFEDARRGSGKRRRG